MLLNAVAVSSSNLPNTIEFYSLLGFQFPPLKGDEQHIEPTTPPGAARLMIDSEKLMTELLGQKPQPGNHSSFAIQYDTPQEIDQVVSKLENSGFTVAKQPWDAFWGQRYAVVEDPDGYKVDLYAQLP